MLTTPEEVLQYMLSVGLIDQANDVSIGQLRGGVSCLVWKIVCGEKRLVLKQALAKLNVAQDWFSDVERIVREEHAMRFLESLLPTGSLPQIVHADNQEHLYVMTCAPEEANTWKNLLMKGQFDAKVALNAGKLLRLMHVNSQKSRDELKSVFQDMVYFEQLRIEPFYIYIKQQYPQLEDEIIRLTKELMENPICMVHGDFSPKNMLIADNNFVILLDYEVAHWGNPVFDVAFLLTHLLLKGWGLKREKESFELIHVFMEEYDRELLHLLRHIGLLLLARLDGKSPVDYIIEVQLKEKIRSTAIAWIQSSSNSNPLDSIRKMLKGEVS